MLFTWDLTTWENAIVVGDPLPAQWPDGERVEVPIQLKTKKLIATHRALSEVPTNAKVCIYRGHTRSRNHKGRGPFYMSDTQGNSRYLIAATKNHCIQNIIERTTMEEAIDVVKVLVAYQGINPEADDIRIFEIGNDTSVDLNNQIIIPEDYLAAWRYAYLDRRKKKPENSSDTTRENSEVS